MKIKNRLNFHKVFKSLNLKGIAVEVGVRNGAYLEYLLKECKFKKVISVSLWEKLDENGNAINLEDSIETIRSNYEKAKIEANIYTTEGLFPSWFCLKGENYLKIF